MNEYKQDGDTLNTIKRITAERDGLKQQVRQLQKQKEYLKQEIESLSARLPSLAAEVREACAIKCNLMREQGHGVALSAKYAEACRSVDVGAFIDNQQVTEGDNSDGYSKRQTFTIRTFHSNEDEGYIAIPDWPPHKLSAFGKTREHALYELCTVIQMVIDENQKLLCPLCGETWIRNEDGSTCCE